MHRTKPCTLSHTRNELKITTKCSSTAALRLRHAFAPCWRFNRISNHIRNCVGVYLLDRCPIVCGAVPDWVALGGDDGHL